MLYCSIASSAAASAERSVQVACSVLLKQLERLLLLSRRQVARDCLEQAVIARSLPITQVPQNCLIGVWSCAQLTFHLAASCVAKYTIAMATKGITLLTIFCWFLFHSR